MFKRGFLNRTDAFDPSAPAVSSGSSAKGDAIAEKEISTSKPGLQNRQDSHDDCIPAATNDSAANGSATEDNPSAEKGNASSTLAAAHAVLSKEAENGNAGPIKPELKSALVGITRRPPSKDVPFTNYKRSIDFLTDPKQMTAKLLRAGYTTPPSMSIRMCTTKPSTLFYKDSIFCVWICYDELLKAIPADYDWGPKETPTPLPRPYRIAVSPGAGLGMFATRDIGVAETILVERPVLMTPQAMPNDKESMKSLTDQAWTFLPQEALKGFDALTCCKAMEKWGEKFGKVMTNSLRCDFPQAELFQTYAGVYLDAARCNHSCCPNTAWSFDSRTLFMELRATRKIAAGEEITISYTNVLQGRAARQKTLSSGYSFSCKCRSCTLPPSQSKASDKRRERLSHTLRVAQSKWKETMEGPKNRWKTLIDTYESGVRVAEQEGYDVGNAQLHRYLAAAYAAIGDEVKFRKWAEKAKDTERLVEKEGFGFVLNGEDWDSWLRDPTSIPCWNLRK